MTPKPLGRHISPALDDARFERQIAAIVARAAPRAVPSSSGRSRRLVVVAAVTALGLVAGGAAWRLGKASRLQERSHEAPTVIVAGTTVEAPAGGETLTLADGSRAVLEPQSKLTLMIVRPELVRVGLERGGVELDVTHADGKELVVVARGYEIRVLGTRFRVRLVDGTLEVEVTRGRVRVTRAEPRDDGDVRVLGPGETWIANLEPARPGSASMAAPEDVPPPEAPTVTRLGAGGGPASAKELLARAEASRAANDPKGAARLFDALRTHHHSDPRAGLAAFELGRLRLDRLRDPRGAAEALSDALSIAPDAPFREDAQARLVEAYEAAGERARCLDARASYLSRYPRGVHRGTIASRCAD